MRCFDFHLDTHLLTPNIKALLPRWTHRGPDLLGTFGGHRNVSSPLSFCTSFAFPERSTLLFSFTGFYLTWLNRKQEIRRQRLGQKGKVVDTSLLTLEDVAAHRKQQKLDQPDGDLTENTRAFDDRQ